MFLERGVVEGKLIWIFMVRKNSAMVDLNCVWPISMVYAHIEQPTIENHHDDDDADVDTIRWIFVNRQNVCAQIAF